METMAPWMEMKEEEKRGSVGSRRKGMERDRENGRVRGRRREMERSDGEKDGV